MFIILHVHLLTLCSYVLAVDVADRHEVERFVSNHGRILKGKHWMYPAKPIKLCEAVVLELVLDHFNYITGHGKRKPTIYMDNWFNTIRLFA